MRSQKQCHYLMTSLISLFFTTPVHATSDKLLIDVYRSTQITEAQIAERFHDDIRAINKFNGDTKNFFNQTALEHYAEQRQHIINQLKKMGDFAFVEMSTINYPGEGFYTTVDLVDAKDKQRLSYFNPAPTKTLPDPDHLLATWATYEKAAATHLHLQNKLNKTFMYCPTFHCLTDYHQPEYQAYYQLFSDKVPKNQKALITVLHEDKNPAHRKSAAYLLAHISDIRTLTQALVPAMYDPDSGVRNATMRVFGAAFQKNLHADFPIEKLVPALDFPMETDRNKALYIAESLAQQPRYAAYLRAHATELLLASLHMHQPNLHLGAYKTLVAISGKHYSSTDFKAWETWLHTQTR